MASALIASSNAFFSRNDFSKPAVVRLDERDTSRVRSGGIPTRSISSRNLIRAGKNNQNLLFNRQRLVLILLQDFHQALAAGQLRLRGLIQLLGAELREGGEVAILREIQAQRAGNLAHGLDLRVAAHAAHGDTRRSPRDECRC